jgi:translation elongation factor EF-1beta
MPQDPVNAVNPRTTPSDFTIDDIDEGDTSLDEGIDRLIDPSLGNERLSNNLDVLDLDRSLIIESEEPDFTGDPGTTDVIAAVEDEGAYFPPTDPPLGLGGFANPNVLGGFADTSLEEPIEPEDHPLRVQGNDEEIAEQVRYALAADAYTADLNIDVEVEYGVVYLHGKVGSIDDIEQAEQIAGSVPGVEDVEEDLEIV